MMSIRSKRLVAVLLDHVVCTYVAGFVPAIILKIVGDDYAVQIVYITLILYAVVVAFKDILFKNASLGKKILGIEVLRKDGTRATARSCVLRNLVFIFLFPVEIILLLNNDERLADKWLDTKVSISNKTGDGSVS